MRLSPLTPVSLVRSFARSRFRPSATPALAFVVIAFIFVLVLAFVFALVLAPVLVFVLTFAFAFAFVLAVAPRFILLAFDPLTLILLACVLLALRHPLGAREVRQLASFRS